MNLEFRIMNDELRFTIYEAFDMPEACLTFGQARYFEDLSLRKTKTLHPMAIGIRVTVISYVKTILNNKLTIASC